PQDFVDEYPGEHTRLIESKDLLHDDAGGFHLGSQLVGLVTAVMSDHSVRITIQVSIGRNQVDHATTRTYRAGHVTHHADIVLDVLQHVGTEDAVEFQRSKLITLPDQVYHIKG